MKRKLLLLIAFPLFFITASSTFQDKVTLELIDENNKETKYEFDWPFNGPPPIGSQEQFMSKVDKILSDNNIDCPPERIKISDNIWKCGNGKKIRTKDERMGRLLSKAWDKN